MCYEGANAPFSFRNVPSVKVLSELAKRSPTEHVRNVSTPILLAIGAKDLRVRTRHSVLKGTIACTFLLVTLRHCTRIAIFNTVLAEREVYHAWTRRSRLPKDYFTGVYLKQMVRWTSFVSGYEH